MPRLTASLIKLSEKFTSNFSRLPPVDLDLDRIEFLALEHKKTSFKLDERVNLCEEFSIYYQEKYQELGFEYGFLKSASLDHLMLGQYAHHKARDRMAYQLIDPTWKQFFYIEISDPADERRQILDAMPDVLFGWSFDLAQFNEELRTLFGLPCDELTRFWHAVEPYKPIRHFRRDVTPIWGVVSEGDVTPKASGSEEKKAEDRRFEGVSSYRK